MNANCNRDGHLKMLKRRKEEKEMGGAEKIRMKKKMLAREAAKCAKLTDLFLEKGAVAGGNVTDEEGGPSSRTGAQLVMRLYTEIIYICI